VVQELLQKLFDKGEIERRTYEGWYCTPDERFWTEKDIHEESAGLRQPVEQIKEDNYFFLMSKYQARLIEHIETHPATSGRDQAERGARVPKHQALGDLCISRPRRACLGYRTSLRPGLCHLCLVRRPDELLFATRYLSRRQEARPTLLRASGSVAG